jgi:soluble lytic murein transglycosylase-like protein
VLNVLLYLHLAFVPPDLPEKVQVKELITQRSHLLGFPLNEPEVDALVDATLEERGSIALPLILAVIEIESKYDRKGKSKKACKGFMQLSHGTAKSMAKRLGLGRFDVYHTKTNVMLGVRYLAALLQENGTILKALTVYNMGWKNYAKRGKKPNGYAYFVVKRSNKIGKLLENGLTCAK